MGVFKATKNRKEESAASSAGTFKATNQRSYDSSMAYEWERANKESANTLQTLTSKSQKNEYLSSDDLDTYRKALDSYIESSNNLRGITKSLGGTLKDDDATWKSNVASMNSAFDATKTYWSQWKDEDAYKKAFADAETAGKELEALKNYDFDASKKEIGILERDLNSINYLEKQIAEINSENELLALAKAKGSKDAVVKMADNEKRIAILRSSLEDAYKQYNGKDALSSLISEKNALYNRAERYQRIGDLTSVSDVNSANYDQNFSTYATSNNAFADDMIYKYINDIEGQRQRTEDAYGSGVSTVPSEGGAAMMLLPKPEALNRNLKYLSEDEIALYNYYYNKQGKDAADEYIDLLQEDLNYRAAEEMFKSVEGDIGLEMIFGVAAGLDQFNTGIESLVSNKDYIPVSATQAYSSMVREDLADAGFTLPDWLGGSSIGQVAYDAITTTSNMLPSIMISTIPGVGSVAGAITLGASSAGHAKAEMLNLGYTKAQANWYGAMVGASEAGLQYLLGGITKLGGKASEGLTKLALEKVDNAIARVAITLGMGMASEGLEESIQTAIEPWLKSLATGVDFESASIDEVLYSGLLGAITSVLFEGASSVAEEVETKELGSTFKKSGATNVDALANFGKQFADETAANRLGNKVNENSSAYDIGRLLVESGSAVGEQNIADISSMLQRYGMSTVEANETAKWLIKAVDGGIFTKRQQKLLEDEPVVRVYQDLVENAKNSVNKRNADYEALYELAKEKSGATKTKADTSKASTQGTETARTTENATEKENATQGKFEASETGKTTHNGSEVKVESVASVKDGNVMLKLNDGNVVNANDVEFSSDEEARLYEAVRDEKMDADTANDFVSAYRAAMNVLSAPQSVMDYRAGFVEAQTYGRLGIPFEALARDGQYTEGLVGKQAQIAYNRGKIIGINNANAAQNAQKTVSAKKAKYKGETHVSDIKKSQAYKGLSEMQKAGVDGMISVYKALGIDVYFFESKFNREGRRVGANGYFNPKDNSIHVDLYAGNNGQGLILFTAAHELTHYIKKNLPAKFKAFADMLFEKYEAEGNSVAERIAAKRAKLEKNGRLRGLSEQQIIDLAYEEVVADACEAMLAKGDAFAELSARVKAKDKGLWEAIKDFFANLVARIKKEYANLNPDSIAGNQVADMLETATELQKAWVEMLVEASTQNNASTDSMQGSADGAVVQTKVSDAMVNIADTEGYMLSTRTEYEAMPKQSMSLTTGAGTILHSIEGLKPTLISGITEKSVSGFTGRAVRGYAMSASGFSKTQIDRVNAFMDTMAEFMKEAGVTYRFIGLQDVENAKLHYTYNPDGSIKSVVLSAMVKNGDYPVNFDLSSICKKREAMSALIRILAQRGSIDNGTVKLTPENIFKINTALKDAGYETACLGCFVESKRYNSLEWAKKFCDKWNAAVKKVNPNATYFGYGNDTFSEESFTLEQAIKIDEAATKYITATKKERLANALAKYEAKQQAGQALVTGKMMEVDGVELNTFSKAARDRLTKSDISEELKEKYLTCDVSTLTLNDVEFLLENGVLPGASLSNKQAVTEMVKSGEAYQHLLRPSDLLTDRGISKLEALPNFHGVLYGHYGSGTPKLMQGYTPYNSEIALLPATKGEQSLAEYLYSIAGVRMQSFSDFQIQNIYDYLQMVADLAARNIPAHAYTKEISFAKLLGMTGIKVNLSVMFDIDPTVDKAHAGLTKLNPLVHRGEYARVVLEDDQGKWVYNIGDYQTQRMFEEAYPDEAKRFLQSIGFADAVKLQSTTGYSSNCGIIGVGYSDLGIFAMLDDNRIRYIIPYHASSLPADIKVATNIEKGTDYTPYQNNMKVDGIVDKDGNKVKWTIKEAYKRLGSGKAVINELNDKVRNEGWVVTTKKAQTGHGTYGLYEDLQATNDPRQTASNFMDWCIGNGTLPLFYQFASHENYYKMLYDYNVYDCVTEEYAPQQAVTNTYPTMVDGEVKAGTVTDGGFDADYLKATINKQMAFMNRYRENLDSDLERLADNMEEGNYSLQQSLQDKFLLSDRDSDYSSRNFSYSELVAKDDLQGFVIGKAHQVPLTPSGLIDSSLVFSEVVKDCKTLQTNGRPVHYVYIPDIGRNVEITRKGVTHGFDRPKDRKNGNPKSSALVNARVAIKIPTILKNSIEVNRSQRQGNADIKYTSVLIGMVALENNQGALEYYAVRSMIQERKNQNPILVESNVLGKLHAINAKKVSTPTNQVAQKGVAHIDGDAYEYSVADFLQDVKGVFENTFSQDVYQHMGTQRKVDDFSSTLLFSDRDPDSVSNRSLLANALESVAKEGDERNTLRNYKTNVKLIEAEQAKLAKVKSEANALRFKRGRTAAENARLKKLDAEAQTISARINRYDSILLKMEAMKPIKEVLAREKQKAYKRASEAGRKAMEAQKARTDESRSRQAIKADIQRSVKKMTKLFKSNKKDARSNVKDEMRGTIASALALADIIFANEISNEDIVLAGVYIVTEKESIALNEYRDLLEQRDSLIAEKEAIQGNGNISEEQYNRIAGIDEEVKAIRSRLSALSGTLSGVFERERIRINKSTVGAMVRELSAGYKALQKSELGYISNAYSEVLQTRIDSLAENLGGKTVRDMNHSELAELRDTLKMIEHMIRESNKLFVEGRKADLAETLEAMHTEVVDASFDRKELNPNADKVRNFVENFSWNNLRPVDAFARLGSATFEQLFWDYIDGMGKAGVLVKESGEVIANARKKYGYAEWDLTHVDKTYKTRDGYLFKPTLADKLSIYAYSQREQAMGHMVDGGFTFDTGDTYTIEEDGKKKKRNRRKLSNTFRLTQEDILEIISSLNKEQTDYVDTILLYLTSLGDKGNEVSLRLYGVKLFNEKVYFPLVSSKDYLNSTDQELGATKTMSSLVNWGAAKPTVPKANNPIVLRAFDDVVLEHIEQMSNYYGLTLPVENLRRVFDNVNRADKDKQPVSTKALIGDRFGVEAQKYFAQLITDLNGGVMSSGARGPLETLFSRAKGMMVSSNLSVVAQQYFAVARAMELIDPKYFTPFLHGEAKKTDMKQYDEMIKYAPIAIIKEMGGFDVGSRGRVKDYIGYEGVNKKSAEYVKKTIDDVASWGASQMDKLGWTTIWKAVKAEVADKQGLTPGTEEFYAACKKRFTEIITKTQVFDSVASRSGYMRSKRDFTKMATSFMGEPTVTVGRLYVALNNLARDIRNGNKDGIKSSAMHLVRTTLSVSAATVLSSLAKALVYAGRDDEEDEAYLERWTRNFGEALADDINLLNSLPYARDAMSILNGFDVERPDTTLLSDIISAVKRMLDGEITAEDSLGLIGSVGNLLGVPLKNLIREIKAAINVIGDLTDDVNPTNMGGSFVAGFTGNERNKSERLYDAVVEGNDGKVEVIKKSYKSDTEYTSALRKALRENDSRVAEAAMAAIENNATKRQNLTLAIEREGKFSSAIVRGAINNEIQYLRNKIADAKAAKKKGDKKEYDKIVKQLLERYPESFVQKALK